VATGRKNEELTSKQKKFCELYVQYWNIGRAYQEAFDSKNKGHPYELFKTEKIQKYIKELKDKLVEPVIVNATDILLELQEIATDPNASKRDRLKALELIGKAKSMWIERIDTNIKTVEFIDDLSEDNGDKDK
jgi:phage terminase small subunit